MQRWPFGAERRGLRWPAVIRKVHTTRVLPHVEGDSPAGETHSLKRNRGKGTPGRFCIFILSRLKLFQIGGVSMKKKGLHLREDLRTAVPDVPRPGPGPSLTAPRFLICDCRGRAAHSWSLPETVRNESRKLSITQSACGSKGRQFCSTLNLTEAQAHHTGFYSCKYLSTPGSKEEEAESTTYIFINGKTSLSYALFPVASQWLQTHPGPPERGLPWTATERGHARGSNLAVETRRTRF